MERDRHGVGIAEQVAAVWPRLKDEKRFYYGGMPTGIATLPETYEDWEFTTKIDPRYDLAAMGACGIWDVGRGRRWATRRGW